MKLEFQHQSQGYFADLEQAVSLAIDLRFDGQQPNHFGTAKASREILRLGGFVGDTEAGGSCNVDVLKLIPHCNGTHTETVSHIVNEDVSIGHSAVDVLTFAAVVSVPIRSASEATKDSYRPDMEMTDRVICRQDLEQQVLAYSSCSPQALIIRTLPNGGEKQTRRYAEGTEPAFFTVEAMELIDSLEIRHLLVDLPSVDRMYDDGLLTNHHLFWHVREGSHQMGPQTRRDRTITEMIFVPDEVKDGVYLLSLQVPSFETDAAPSRPLVIPVERNGKC